MKGEHCLVSSDALMTFTHWVHASLLLFTVSSPSDEPLAGDKHAEDYKEQHVALPSMTVCCFTPSSSISNFLNVDISNHCDRAISLPSLT
jgi:hypothetical protein